MFSMKAVLFGLGLVGVLAMKQENSDSDHDSSDKSAEGVLAYRETRGGSVTETNLERGGLPIIRQKLHVTPEGNCDAKGKTLLTFGMIFATFGAFGSALAFGEIQQEFSTKMDKINYDAEVGAIVMGVIGIVGAFVFLAFWMAQKEGFKSQKYAIGLLATSGVLSITGLILSKALENCGETAVKGSVYGTLIAGGAFFAIAIIVFFFKGHVSMPKGKTLLTVFTIATLTAAAVYSGINLQESLYDVHGTSNRGMGDGHAFGIGALFVIGFICLGGLLANSSWNAHNAKGRYLMIAGTVAMGASGVAFAFAVSQPATADNFGSLNPTCFVLAGVLLTVGLVVLLSAKYFGKCRKIVDPNEL